MQRTPPRYPDRTKVSPVQSLGSPAANTLGPAILHEPRNHRNDASHLLDGLLASPLAADQGLDHG